MLTPLGKKKSLSAAMAGNKEDTSMIDPKNVIDAEYDDVPEEHGKALKDQIRAFEAEYKKQLASCFRKTRQGVIEKEKFVMPTFPLLIFFTTTSTSASASVVETTALSESSSSATLEQVQKLLAERDVHWVNWLSSNDRKTAGKKPEIANEPPSNFTVATSEVYGSISFESTSIWDADELFQW